jgi:hypothetical protein
MGGKQLVFQLRVIHGLTSAKCPARRRPKKCTKREKFLAEREQMWCPARLFWLSSSLTIQKHGINLISDRIPKETTILTFRHLLEQNKFGEQIYCFAGLRLRDCEWPFQGAGHGHEAGHDHRCHLDRCSQLYPYRGRRPSGTEAERDGAPKLSIPSV